MKCIEIKNQFNMDAGAPNPMIFSAGNKTSIVFFGTLIQNSDTQDIDTVLIEFTGCIKSSIGLPNDEVLHNHPYYALGLRSYRFYELESSDVLAKILEMQKVHSGFNFEKWRFYKHYIITFHDEMFECIAKGFSVSEGNELYRKMIGLVS